MAKPEQTEKATPKRQGEARQRGQVPRSPDIGGALIFLIIIITLHLSFVPTFTLAAHSFAVAIQSANGREPINIHSAWGLFARGFAAYSALMMVAFLGAVVIALLANVLQFGFLFSPQMLKPKFSKLNPVPGFKRLFFSAQTLVNLLKQVLKVLLVVIIVFTMLHDQVPMFYQLAHASPSDLILYIEGLAYGIGIRFGLLLFCIGLGDYFWAKHQLADSLKMTKTEVRDEHRQQEGNPEVKQAVKQRQRASARRRMMAAIPRATVVVTNPTHFAVALEWDEITMDAPILTCKGADLMARRIRELAREHNVPIMENPPLARALYDKVELDSPVPPNLYAAVAQVIAFIYKLKNRTIA
ncbi:MAG: flagellar biosynthesis protein FlhB [Candidatus Lustribacter sp.]|jgi:flagellar biosynthetic protein FlhB